MIATTEQQAGGLTESLLGLAVQLEPGEAFVVKGIVLARSKVGKLRVAFGDIALSWFRGDTETLLREHLESMLDWTKTGYYAGDVRRAVEGFIANPSAIRMDGIGRVQPRFHRASYRKLVA